MLPPLPSDFRGTYRTDVDACAVYSESAGIMRVVPLGVAVPDQAEDLQSLCRWAQQHAIPLIARGSGSSMSGGAVGPGLIVDLHRLRSVSEVDTSYDRIRVGAAVTRARTDDLARAKGLRFPVDPSSGSFATIGGMAATNAAGPRSMRFGPMRHWVRALDCIFADGSRCWVSRSPHTSLSSPVLERWQGEARAIQARCSELPRRAVRKESSGYGIHDFAQSGDLVDLLVGSEGTLAFFVEAELDLIQLPMSTGSLLSSWPTLEQALHGAVLARESRAAACELLDTSFLQVASRARTLPIPRDSECVLLVELEGAEAGATAAIADALADAWRRAGATVVLLGLDPESEESLWSLRHAASPILSRLDPHIRSMQIVEDGCVPPHRLAEYVRGVRQALVDSRLDGVLFGHAGDAHVHVNALVDVRRAAWRDSVRALFDRVLELTANLGGTLCGEHGDGRLRTPSMHRLWSADTLRLFADIKALLDPTGILNPGVKTGPANDPFAMIKYDPEIRLASGRAALVLERVERERAYAACRLELLDETG
ncbi:MAG: FAD-binding oxidoreductase [Gemmatimonadaceae bacterium]